MDGYNYLTKRCFLRKQLKRKALYTLVDISMIPITVPYNFRIIAHRGASAYAPENTMAAFDLAVNMGITEIETDTQLCTDGTVVLCHDPTLERYGHGTKLIEDHSVSELLSLDMGSWFSPFLYSGETMVTLYDLFSQYRDKINYHIELKGESTDLPKKVLEHIHKFELSDFCIVTSFSYESLKQMRSLTRDLRLGWLVNSIDSDICNRAEKLDLFQLCPHADVVTPEMVKLGKTVAYEIRAWGISDQPEKVEKSVQQVIDSGCDGMTINWPDWVVH